MTHSLTKTKGIPMFIDFCLAIVAIITIGAAVNYIGHLVSK